MKATNELRVGNLLKDKILGKTHQVKSIEYGSFKCKAFGMSQFPELNPSEVEPIPLTEEWFKKFGYKPEFYGGQGNVGYSVLVKGLGRFFSHDGLIWHPNMALARFLKGELKYVHKFQNLYHELMGVELSIKK